MEILMTVLSVKRFWPNYKLKKAVNQWKSASQRPERGFQRQTLRVLTGKQFTTTPGLRTFQILIVLLYIMVLNFAQSFVCAYYISPFFLNRENHKN